ncbi:hypothetical protein HPB47_023133 [Ixodes persulcatus]|uniref:Uncharacterized protein n=1 Tax=Ixodes persulcatus TaxID=34615 RepID=A0AC60Q8Y2_IXOPE|nr:hypothetical protein HPB47_023133 [Ixodes persulcatus]
MASDMETDAPQDSRAPSLETKKRKFQNDGEDSVSLTPESEEDNAGWTEVQRRRRLPAKRYTATAERLTKNKFLVLIRPRGQHPITEIPKSDLGRALIQLAPHPSLGKYVSTRMDARSNSITVTAYDSTHADRICQLHQIPRENSTPFEIEALHLRPRGTSRGVIRVDPVGTNESLKDNVDCEHAAVLDVKRMGRSNFAIVSFDTSRLPKTVRYSTELCSVSPYVPRTLVCFHCHKDCHLQKHCPNAAVCKTCGKQRRLEENKSRTERRSRSRSRRRTANAAAAPAHVSSPMPSDLSTDFPPLSPDAPLTPVTTKGSYRSPARKAVNFATSCTSATPVAGTTYATATSGKPKRSKKASARTKQEIQELTTRICELQQRLEELYQVQKEQEQEEEREHQQQLREERRRRAQANHERRSSQSPAPPRRTETPTPDPAEAITLSQIQAMIVQTTTGFIGATCSLRVSLWERAGQEISRERLGGTECSAWRRPSSTPKERRPLWKAMGPCSNKVGFG